MARRGRRSDVEVERLQITLAKADVEYLDRVIRLGRFGRNRNEAAANVIVDWLNSRFLTELATHLERKKLVDGVDHLSASNLEATK